MAGNTHKGSYPPDHPVYQQPSTIGLVKFDDDELEDYELLEEIEEVSEATEAEKNLDLEPEVEGDSDLNPAK